MRTTLGVALGVFATLLGAARAEPDRFGVGNGHHGALAVNAGATVVNRYAVLMASAAAGASALVVDNITGFAAGDLVLVLQATGLAAPNSGDQTPVDLSASPVGHWELARLRTLSGNTLSLTAPLVASFTSGVTQVVKVPEYTTVTVANGASLVAQPWDGARGGVLAFLASGVVTNNGALSADAAGYRGAPVVQSGGNYTCDGNEVAPPNGARKGEGVAPTGFSAMRGGRGNVANGGGGGVCHNSGGAGGGNGGQGGRGGRSWSGDNPASRLVGGHGGAKLVFSLLTRLAFGGGGGAGEENNNQSLPGGAGGGAVFVRALGLAGTGRVSANGQSPGTAPPTGNDAQGGGGAGGSIYLRVAGAVACNTIEARGGSGGSTPYATHGPGGGGGGGHVMLQSSTLACALNVNAGIAGTQSNANAVDGPSYGAQPAAPNDPGSLGVIETPPAGAYCGSDAHCSGTTPVCDVLAGVCRRCASSAECTTATKPICNLPTGECRACGADGECTAKSAAAPACQTMGALAGSCGECSGTNKTRCTGTKPGCNTMTALCVACRGDADCGGSTPACQMSGACGECSIGNRALCVGNKPVCNILTGLCRACAADPDCGGSTPACEPWGACGECSSGNKKQCTGTKPACDTMKGLCIACRGDTDCGLATPACQMSGACGECSMANRTACVGTKPVCDVAKGQCVACFVDGDCKDPAAPACQPSGACGECSKSNQGLCGGNRPLCDLLKGACVACLTDANCFGATPACEPWGACGECSKTNLKLCGGPKPFCDEAKGVCRGCAGDGDCGGQAPACQPGGLCGECSKTNRALCVGTRPVCDEPKGQCRGCGADAECPAMAPACLGSGACGECSKNNKVLCVGAKPVCNETQSRCVLCTLGPGGDAGACAKEESGHACVDDGQGGVFCGCDTDADCGAKDSGRVCDGLKHRCAFGCSPAANRNGCPKGRFCTSDDLSGMKVGICTIHCNFDKDCVPTPATPLCLAGDGGISRCVGCKSDADCKGMAGMEVCSPDFTCVECTPMKAMACRPDRSGGACLINYSCGCAKDTDCATGLECNQQTSLCVPVPPPADLSQPADLGAPEPDLAVPTVDLAQAQRDLAVAEPAPDLASQVFLSGGGCGCRLGAGASRHDAGAQNHGAIVLCLMIVALLARRRRA